MMVHQKNLSDGARPLLTQGGSVLGSPPRRSPPSATRGQTCLKIMHWNAEGIQNKKMSLNERLRQENIDIACIQETHLKEALRLNIRGYEVIRKDRTDRIKGGVAILVRNSIPYQELQVDTGNEAEIHGVVLTVGQDKIRIFNEYCPVDKDLSLSRIETSETNCLVVGDFNSHSEAWGYAESDQRGEEIEDWQIDQKLLLINDPDDAPTFYSRRWLTTTTPDLALATEDLARKTTRRILDQLGGSDHRPVLLTLDLNFKPPEEKCFPRWNYKKANWTRFSQLTDEAALKINNKQDHINKKIRDFNQALLNAAKSTIPRGARRNYKPYWTEELQQLEDDLSKARDDAENNPGIESNIALKEATVQHRKVHMEEARKSWAEKTEGLNFDKDGRKLWKLTKALNDEGSKGGQITLQPNDEPLTGKQAADHFIDEFAEISNLEVPERREEDMREKLLEYDINQAEEPMPMVMDSPFNIQEFEAALSTLLLRKAPGPDQITNEMLLHIGPQAKKKLLQLMNDSWRSGIVPGMWREATMVPIHKKGKDKSKATSYRPISLTSCMGKLMERLINNRLMWHLESEGHINVEQAAFRQNRSTEDQVTYLTQAIEDAFQDKKHTLAVWIDLEKAFDKVWRDGLRLKLRQCGIAGRMFKWIDQYMRNRKGRVKVKHHKSKVRDIKHGVPQGGVLSPTLFLVFMKDILQNMPRGVKGAMYADDLVLWCSADDIGTANLRLREALTALERWTQTWMVRVNKDKTTYTVFTLSTKQQRVNLQFDSHTLREEETPTYLGITFDKRLTWKAQLQKNQTKAKIRMALMKKLAGTKWGANHSVLKKMYVGRIRPTLEYGMSATCTASKAQQKKRNTIQNQAMRIMTGAMCSTPVTSLENITGLQSLEERSDIKVLTQAAKFKRLDDHPMQNSMKQPTKNRLKRTSFVKHSKSLERQQPDLMDHIPEPIQQIASVPLWNRQTFPKISTTIPGIATKGMQPGHVRKDTTLDYIESHYAEEEWTHVYTDGSAAEATRDGGAGIYIRYLDREAEHSIATGKYSTNFKAEAKAIQKAAEELLQNTDQIKRNVVILTDALSVLDALKNHKKKDLNSLNKVLAELGAKVNVVLQWIPAHCGIPGNEAADRLAKEGGSLEQDDRSTTYQEVKTTIKTLAKKKWHKEHQDYNQKDQYYRLDREDQVIIFRLRTGHNRMHAHLNKLKISETELCTCGTAPMTTEHILQNCPDHAGCRKDWWPKEIPLRVKLYGGLLDLERTAAFMKETEVTI